MHPPKKLPQSDYHNQNNFNQPVFFFNLDQHFFIQPYSALFIPYFLPIMAKEAIRDCMIAQLCANILQSILFIIFYDVFFRIFFGIIGDIGL